MRRAFVILLLLLATASLIGTALILEREDLVETFSSLLPGAFFFCLLGAVIVLRRPDNRMGWIFAAIGFFNASGMLADEYASMAIAGGNESSTVVLAAWYSEWWWIPFVFLTFCLSLLLFPSGSPPSPRWRPFVGVVVAVMLFFVVVGIFDPVVAPSGAEGVRNPLGIDGLADVDDPPFNGILGLALPLSALAALGSLVIRFRRAGGEERQQLKWFTYSAVLLVLTFIVIGLMDFFTGTRMAVLESLSISLLPLGAGIAILKYRLYDIDVIINRTLVYVALTAVLIGTYAGAVLLFRTLLAPVTGDSDLAIAASTLVVAALFGPARRRIQAFIDRRFYRSRYDGQQTLEAFAARLRDEVDLDAVAGEMLAVVSNTVHPRHASVWLTGSER